MQGNKNSCKTWITDDQGTVKFSMKTLQYVGHDFAKRILMSWLSTNRGGKIMKLRTIIKKAILSLTCAATILGSIPVTAHASAADDMINKIRNVPKTAQVYDGSKTFSANLAAGQTVTNCPIGIYTCFAYANELYYYLFGDLFAKSYSKASLNTALVTIKNNNITKLVANIKRADYGSNAQYKKAAQQVIGRAVPGDVIAAVDGKYYHFMIFMYSKDTNGDGLADEFYTAEGNYNNSKKTAIEYRRTADYFINNKNVAMSLYHCTNNQASSGSGSSESKPAQSCLSIDGVSPIGTIKEGNTYPIDGTVNSNYNLNNVTGVIYNSNGNEVYKKSVNPGRTSYKLKNSTIDYAMLFNYLSPGNYTYKVYASDIAGGYKENSQGFVIEGKNAEAERKAREEAEARAREEAEAKAREEAEAKAREEEAAAKAAEDAAKAAEEAAKQDEQQNSNSSSQSNSCNTRQDIIVLPDYDDEEITLRGDVGKYDLHVSRNSGTEIFTAASDRLTIITRGQVEDLVCGGIRTDASKHFSMYLYDVTDGYERYVSGYYANCDNIEGGLEFDVQEGHQYKIRFDTTGLSYKEAVIGDGHVYPVR